MGLAANLVLVAGAVLLYLYMSDNRPPFKITKEPLTKYDFIVVGAGASGAPLAARLSEDPDVNVLLLEAGPAEYPDAETPANYGKLQLSDIDWAFKTETENYCCSSLNNKSVFWPRGKGLGGSTLINGMAYIRGSRHDYDAWEEQGCDGWGYDDVLPYFIKSESNQNPEFAASGYHGTEGPVKVSDVRTTPLVDYFLKAGEELGNRIRDINADSIYGTMHMQSTVYKGRRWSSAEAYLRSESHRLNLHIVTEAHVSRVLFDGTRAVGVEFLHDGQVKEVRVHREVILSAGTVGTPHILLLSGVGPKQELDRHKIAVVADLPVGENLQDHVFSEAGLFNIEKPLSHTAEKRESLRNKLQYALLKTGIQTSFGTEGSAFYRSPLQPSDVKIPYIQLQLFVSHLGNGNNPKHTNKKQQNLNIIDQVWKELFGNYTEQEGFVVYAILLRPSSRGSVTLRSVNPRDHPVIRTNYLQEPIDVEHLLEGVKLVMKMEDTPSFRSLGARVSRRHLPLCRDYDWGTDDYWRCFIKSNTLILYHPTSTCKMGAPDDATAVVDPQLRVRDLQGLRIADASVIPFVASGKTMAASIMIGEKGADIIKKHYNIK